MTKQQLIEKLKEMHIDDQDYRDCEADHAKADGLLLEYIGDPEVSEAFEKIEKWYP